MNERIEQLVEQADNIEILPDEEFCDTDFLADIDPRRVKKFAELIVAECVSVIQEELDSGQYSQPVHTGFRVSKNLIKEHFGVEE